ncbi:thiaminase (transcriptional activator TenA) [Tistlia consotensis]|uniref:Thiaminase (Transcriptional activator TenA) n=1 Tax=Tistlia consotensis USBA 355 TaxID=560819 RepID=A0A1Y6C7T7_9PROT|nr:TenA family protein [Tistlia consotensis]SMF41071.1 thiaminase (transcriptional activator TenA) [Tistlia consotensis USBA 355]SNR74095.1 thiaminase (transcriptional activator TenA) [Tistlia consotensis]
MSAPRDPRGGLFGALTAACGADWRAYVGHPFVRGLADGSLPERCFRHYLAQDYLFLLHYSRAWSLAVVKSDRLDDLRQSAALVDLLLNHEIALHVDFCGGWGLDETALAATPEAPANRLYTRYVMDRGLAGDLLDLLVALAPCGLGYAEIGRRLLADPATKREGNPYLPWIELYGGAEFQEGAAAMAAQLDRVAGRRGLTPPWDGSARWPSISDTFATAVRLEVGFWDMGLAPPA